MFPFVMSRFSMLFHISNDVSIALTGAVSMTHCLERSDHERSALWLRKALYSQFMSHPTENVGWDRQRHYKMKNKKVLNM